MPPDATNEADVNADPYVPVGEFFAERSVFVTGATGFLGKVLVEKLLRSCPGVKVIYLLMRPKRGRGLEERLADIIDSALFDRLKKEQPLALSKIIPINGDIGEPDLGITLTDQETLTRNVSVVFHSAATIKLNERLKIAVEVNLLGTKRIVELCRRMEDLQALVHVSTCYSNSDLEFIDEVVYPPPYDPENILQCTQWMDDELLAHITPKLLGKKPNTYTFTKALAENMLVKEGAGLPIAILRSSLISPTWKEPMVGWMQGIGGAAGVLAGYTTGMLRTLHCDGAKVVDLIPADMVVNLMICAAWKASTASKEEPVVYNCCSGAQNPVTFGECWTSIRNTSLRNPPKQVVWYPPSEIYSSNERTHLLKDVFLHSVPAYLMDYARSLAKKKPMLVKLDQKIRAGVQVTEFVMTNGWRFKDDKVKNLIKCLSHQDQQVFYYDVAAIDWPSYNEEFVMAVRKHILMEDPSTIPQCRKSLKRLLWIKRASELFGLLFVLLVVMFVFF